MNAQSDASPPIQDPWRSSPSPPQSPPPTSPPRQDGTARSPAKRMSQTTENPIKRLFVAMIAGVKSDRWPLSSELIAKVLAQIHIGQGTYSNVYKARDNITGKIVALKKVRFDNLEPESVRFMAREILIVRRLDQPNVVKLQGLATSKMSCILYLVFDYMVHDLAGLAASPGIKFSDPQVKCFMHQLLSGLEHCHNRNVLHRDIKGSNLLIDEGGVLKMADFGLASTFDPNNRQAMTSRVFTLWYRPPELLLGATYYVVGIDLWGAGCILAELFAGKPIMTGQTEDFQAMRFSIRRILEKVKASSCDHVQTATFIQKMHTRDI
ncbi:hypothetical protein CASFOL_000454 [Castilleja foliolosa]|uniref:Protein kinase domain-containing protein n=1 Tax=Castilleja foliolosa TaxID=1961234 RepID=A0ABD3ENY8_9LAMI